MRSALPLAAAPGLLPDQGPGRVLALLVIGVSLMVGAFGLDVIAHGRGLLSLEPAAHGAGVLGMVITWGAVVIDGLRHAARPA